MVDEHPTKCNLCGGKVEFIDNAEIYGAPYGSGKAYICRKCGAYVGTHKNCPDRALGLLADERMRLGKRYCHSLFDKLWHTQRQRTSAYRRLAKDMGIGIADCHFGHFDLPQLKKAYLILRKWEEEKK